MFNRAVKIVLNDFLYLKKNFLLFFFFLLIRKMFVVNKKQKLYALSYYN